MTVLSKEQAREQALPGWNIRCNLCGSYGASWLMKARPGWGALALCPTHREEYLAELARHDKAIATLSVINFEQDRGESG
jgi:hypothetical protein